MSKQHAVTIIKDGEHSLALVGFLGTLGMITGVNDDGVFAAIFDSPVGGPAIDCVNKSSYYMDLRYALEQFDNKEDISYYMRDPSHNYTYNHNIMLSDRKGSQVVENYVGGQRLSRHDTDALNPGIAWPFEGAIAVVNSFALAGMPDNHTVLKSNTERWNTLLGLTKKLRRPVLTQDVQRIMSFQQGPSIGHIYRGIEYLQEYKSSITLQQVIYESGKNRLKVHFTPETGPVIKPKFEHIPIYWRQ